jgi:hypothetical protein
MIARMSARSSIIPVALRISATNSSSSVTYLGCSRGVRLSSSRFLFLFKTVDDDQTGRSIRSPESIGLLRSSFQTRRQSSKAWASPSSILSRARRTVGGRVSLTESSVATSGVGATRPQRYIRPASSTRISPAQPAGPSVGLRHSHRGPIPEHSPPCGARCCGYPHSKPTSRDNRWCGRGPTPAQLVGAMEGQKESLNLIGREWFKIARSYALHQIQN